MAMTNYKIVDDFPANTARVLILDRKYDSGDCRWATIDGKAYNYVVNYGLRTIILPDMAKSSFKGKTISFD